jgi:hypothetical protein
MFLPSSQRTSNGQGHIAEIRCKWAYLIVSYRPRNTPAPFPDSHRAHLIRMLLCIYSHNVQRIALIHFNCTSSLAYVSLAWMPSHLSREIMAKKDGDCQWMCGFPRLPYKSPYPITWPACAAQGEKRVIIQPNEEAFVQMRQITVMHSLRTFECNIHASVSKG